MATPEALLSHEQLLTFPGPIILGIGDGWPRAEYFFTHEEGTLVCLNPIFKTDQSLQKQGKKAAAITLPGTADKIPLPDASVQAIQSALFFSYYPVIEMYKDNFTDIFNEVCRVAAPGATWEILDSLPVVTNLQDIFKQMGYSSKAILGPDIDFIRGRSSDAYTMITKEGKNQLNFALLTVQL